MFLRRVLCDRANIWISPESVSQPVELRSRGECKRDWPYVYWVFCGVRRLLGVGCIAAELGKVAVERLSQSQIQAPKDMASGWYLES